MVVGGNPDVGKEVKLARLRAAPEFNGLKGTITDDLGGGKWLVKLDDGMVEGLISNGYVKPNKGGGESTPDTKKPIVPKDGTAEYTIAGTWDAYVPHDMEWVSDELCYKFYAQVSKKGASFYIVRGRAGEKKLKYKGKTWAIPGPGESSWFEIKLTVKETGTVNKVEWVKDSSPPDSTMAVAETDAE